LCVFKNTEIRVVAVVGIPCDVIACIWQGLPDEINYPLRFSASLKALVAAALKLQPFFYDGARHGGPVMISRNTPPRSLSSRRMITEPLHSHLTTRLTSPPMCACSRFLCEAERAAASVVAAE